MATIKQPVVVVDVSPSSASFRSPSIIISGLPADEISREHYAIATASIPGISIKLNDAFILATATKGNITETVIADTKRDVHESVNDSMDTESINTVSYVSATDTRLKTIVSHSCSFDTTRAIDVQDTVKSDTYRDTLVNESFKVDLSRSITAYFAIDVIQNIDALREIFNDYSYRSYVLSRITVNDSIQGDTEADIAANDSVQGDTHRNLTISSTHSVSTARTVLNDVTLSASMIRRLIPGPQAVSVTVDTECSILNNVSINADIKTYASQSFSFDVKRNILNDVSYNSSLLRRIPFDTSFTGIPAHRPKPGDPFHVWPAEKPKPGPVSIEINLNEQTLSDSFALETTQEIDINNMISGRIIDFDYVYQIGDIDWTDLTRTAGGMYDVDEILYRMITYKNDSALNIKVCAAKTPAGEIGKEIAILGSTDSAITNWYLLSAHAARIGNALNKRVVFLCDNFKCNSTWTGNGNTYQSIISTLFGWSSSIPHMMINVFMRAKDNTLYVVQRGHELSVIDINDTKHTRPHIKKTLERTAWSLGRDNSGGGSSTQQSGGGGSASAFYDIDGEGGTAKYTEASSDSSSSSGGGQTLLSHEETEDSVTDYHYDADGHGGYQLMSKVTRNKKDNSRTETTYHYDMINGGWMMTCEKETNYSPEGVEQFTRKTTHIPIGNGGVSTHVYEGTWGNMKLISSSVSEGTGVSNQYRAAEETYALTKSTGEKKVWDSGLINLPVASVGDVSNYDQLIDFSKVPTDDKDVLLKYTKAVMWLNRKVRETVEMDIYEYDHVVDFTERVRFRGNEYYLSSNKISQTTRELKQTVTLVRWY